MNYLLCTRCYQPVTQESSIEFDDVMGELTDLEGIDFLSFGLYFIKTSVFIND